MTVTGTSNKFIKYNHNHICLTHFCLFFFIFAPSTPCRHLVSIKHNMMRAMMMMNLLLMTLMNIILRMVTQLITTMTKSHHGGELSVTMKAGMFQCQKPTIHHDELYFGVYVYQVTHITQIWQLRNEFSS